MTILYLIRHGETGGNSEGRFQGIIDNPLNETGIEQAERLGMTFSLADLDVIYTSPLERARQTAQIIAQMHGLKKLTPIPKKGLMEMNGGLLEGKRFSDIEKEYPEVLEAMNHHLASLQCPQGESMKELYHRISQTINQIVEDNRGQVIVAVSHGIAISAYIHYASGKPFDEMPNCMIANASINKCVFDDDGNVTIEYLDDCRHMKEGSYLKIRNKHQE